jgi:hypothetical protein
MEETEVLDNNTKTAADAGSVKIDSDKAIYVFKNTNKEDLGGKIKEYLSKQGYKVEQGVPTSAVYGKGSKVMRILFGAFVKRFEWKVDIAEINDSTGLTFTKNSKGYMGGVIGVQQVKKEYSRLTGVLKAFHENHNSK